MFELISTSIPCLLWLNKYLILENSGYIDEGKFNLKVLIQSRTKSTDEVETKHTHFQDNVISLKNGTFHRHFTHC